MQQIKLFGPEPAQSLPVYVSDAFSAIDGANLGDPLAHAAELIAGDIYMLAPGAARARIAVSRAPAGDHLAVAPGSELGQAGAPLHLDCCATFMSPDGSTIEVLILVELAPEDATIAATYVYPLAPLTPKRGYALVAIDRAKARARFAETACVSFTRGTHITLASGLQAPIETLSDGDMVLTRDNGPQKIRWIGQQTVRAIGSFAPIRIAKGALNNENDLIVSPNHRLFIYQRRDATRSGRAEILVKAKYLLNGDTVTLTDGGFVDYYQILFDGHEIIYAEGIAAESLIVDTRNRDAVPREVHDRLTLQSVQGRHGAVDIMKGALDATEAAAILRSASIG